MAREARKLSSEGLYVVELSGEKLFFDDEDRRIFKETAEKAFSDGGKIYGYFLGDGCVKMVVKESSRGISQAMKTLKISYARYFNRTHTTSGSLFAGRFKSEPLESETAAQQAAVNLGGTEGAKKAVKKVSVKKTTEKAVKTPAKKAAKAPAKKAAAAKKTVSQKTEKKIEQKIEQKPEKKSEKKTVKKNNKSLPSWLL